MAAVTNIEKIWDKSLSKIAEKVGNSTFDLWFKPIKLLQLKDKTIALEIPNRFFRDWIEDNYPTIIADAVESILGYPLTVKYKTAEKEDAALRRMDSRLENRRNKLASRGKVVHTLDNIATRLCPQFSV